MSRNSRLTADVSLEAHNLLRGYAEKHERSKGFLLEKMIRKFCAPSVDYFEGVETKDKTELAVTEKPKPKAKQFKAPTPLEVDGYMVERGINDPNEAQSFCDFYESKGWVVGKAKMKCWKAATRNWLKGYKAKTKGTDILQLSADSNWEEGINEIF